MKAGRPPDVGSPPPPILFRPLESPLGPGRPRHLLQEQVRAPQSRMPTTPPLTPPSFTATFFSLGQVLPTYRLKHSPHGGINQPTITEAIHLLSGSPSTPSRPPTTTSPSFPVTSPANPSWPPPHPHSHLSWVHVFPEGCVHQHPASSLRYFKWGISRLILESTPTPAFLPIFIDGTQHVMPEDRTFPRFLPRIRKRIRVVFGEEVDVREVFGDQIDRWNEIKHRVQGEPGKDADLDAWKEAVGIRIEVARRAREEVLKVRRGLGYPDDDESLGRAETWARNQHRPSRNATVEGNHVSSKR